MLIGVVGFSLLFHIECCFRGQPIQLIRFKYEAVQSCTHLGLRSGCQLRSMDSTFVDLLF